MRRKARRPALDPLDAQGDAIVLRFEIGTSIDRASRFHLRKPTGNFTAYLQASARSARRFFESTTTDALSVRLRRPNFRLRLYCRASRAVGRPPNRHQKRELDQS